jgi:HD superfamily phosphodiesterase
MTTESGRRIAEQRHHVMQTFLKEFKSEWDGADVVV